MDIKFNKRFEWKDLPDMDTMRREVDAAAKDITVGETLFFKEHGVKSENEYKLKCMKNGELTKHSHVGWNSWDETAKNIKFIYEELKKRGSYITRFGFICDWVMGVPKEYRHKLPKGTGLCLETPEEWAALGQVVPVQPHLSDHMIGCPNAWENTVYALKAGATSIGNVSHYFTYEYPGVDLEYDRTWNSMKAFYLMGKFEGTVVHSNIDDGFGNQFTDLISITGWAIMERYIVEELLGARLSHAYGNLFSDPMGRIIMHNTMQRLNKYKTPGTMIFGNTVDYGLDLERNFGALSSFSLADAIFQRHCPTGHSVASVPVTEAIRVPTAQEIVDGHLCVDMMIEKSKFMEPYIDWAKIEAETDVYLAAGNLFFERMMNGLEDLGVDTKHPGQIMAALKAIGPKQLEDNFGVGAREKDGLRERMPVRPTDMTKTLISKKSVALGRIGDIEKRLEGKKVIVGTTDIHDYGKEVVKTIIAKAGATVFDLGTYVTPDELIETVLETEAKVIIISTYNGIALTYAKEVVEKIKKDDLDVKLVMGGLINENLDGGSLAEDVTLQVKDLGVNCDNNMDLIVDIIEKIYSESK
jgi:methylmalonyl-CoA mutase cobalamin-binding domain/chain